MTNIDIVSTAKAETESATAVKDYSYWDNLAVKCEKENSKSNLRFAEAIYNISLDYNWQKLGFKSIQDYTYQRFNRGSDWTTKMILVHKKFAIELGRTFDEMEAVGFGKLGILCSHVNADNIVDMMFDAKNSTQQEIREKVNKMSETNTVATTDEAGQTKEQTYKTLKIKGPIESIEVIEDAITMAKEMVLSLEKYNRPEDVPDIKALEIMCAFFSTGSLDSNPVTTLDKAIVQLENAFKIKMAYELTEENVNFIDGK